MTQLLATCDITLSQSCSSLDGVTAMVLGSWDLPGIRCFVLTESLPPGFRRLIHIGSSFSSERRPRHFYLHSVYLGIFLLAFSSLSTRHIRSFQYFHSTTGLTSRNAISLPRSLRCYPDASSTRRHKYKASLSSPR